MDRNRSNNPQRQEGRSRVATKNKENSLSDTVCLIQNQNEVLRMKNTEMNVKIKELKMQLQRYTNNIVLQESDIDNMKTKIVNTSFKGDIEIENQKRLLTEKLILLKSEEQILMRKIKEAREATIFEEEKVAQIQNDRKGIEVGILSLKAQNQGTKVVLKNLEEQNERLRVENQKLISKRKVHEPKQKQISIEIEERIRIIKSQQQHLKNLKKNETSTLMISILTTLFQNKTSQHFSKLQRYSLLRKIAQKRIVQMSLIRKKYTLFIKKNIIEQLRSKFRPLAEQQTAKRIIFETHKRRIKASIWRKWRKQTKNAEFTTTRRFQFLNTIQKISESFEKTNIFSTFNLIKYFRNNPFHQNAVSIIDHAWTRFMNRTKTHFFSGLREATKKYEIQKQIQASSKEQSEMLVMSLYFTAWGKLAKSRSIENKNLKRRYFKELKKVLALKNRKKLGEMLTETNKKLNEMQTISKNFSQLKRQSILSKLESLNSERDSYQQKKLNMQDQLHQMHSEKKDLYQELALIKISKYLKKKVQKAFNIWRLRKQQSKVILTIMNLIESKKGFDKNFAFAQILKKRFAMLKKSINDKIQSCEFSYNYLLDENKHIKEVLDHKTHDLEKTKFMNILKKINRNQKEMKLKYFMKFMRSGFKFWKFRKVCERLDKMTERKIKVVFIWLLKQDNYKIRQENRIESFVHNKEKIIMDTLLKSSLKGFQLNRERCKRIKRVMGGIFDRNFELDFYVAFGKIRNEQHLYQRGLIQHDIDEVQGEINKTNAVADEQTKKIEILKNRLADKEQTFAERKILGLYRFFIKNIKIKVGSCLQKWKSRVKRQSNVLQFAKILQRKSRIVLKNKFLHSISRKQEDQYLIEFQQRMKKFQSEYDKLASNQEKFLKQNQTQSARMKGQIEIFKNDGEILEKKTDFMTNIKLKSFRKAWGKKILKWCFRQWKVQTDIFVDKWSRIDKKLSNNVLKQNFTYFIKEMKEELFNLRIRTNLEKIYVKTYRFNLGLGFRNWRYVLLEKHVQIWTEEEKMQMKRFEGLQKKYKYAIGLHDSQLTYRQYDPTIRGLWNAWRQYTQNKIYNNHNKITLEKWLYRGYCSQFLRLVKKKVNKKIAFRQKYNKFIKKWEMLRMRVFYEYTSQNKHRRNTVERLFLNKFSPFMIHKVMEDVMTRIKNYGNNQIILKKEDKSNRIQQVIQTFQKKRKSILSFYLRKWNRNQYEMRIAKNLMRKITRNAMNWKVRDLFYTWKLEAEAKRVKQLHEEEGEVRKRINQINRLKVFLQDYKKDKGLLLEDDGGKFVLSPRFQEKKDLQIKKDNNLRYKFISRLILSMNGYSAPARAWNNMKIYMLVREKIKKHAKMVKNNLRKPELHYAFKIWHKASVDFNKMFDTMQRKGLIKILNRQKDKMEMEYSKKISLQQKIHQEMKYHKLLSYHEDRKEKLCAHLLLKNVRKIKLYSLLTWKDRIRELKQTELQSLEDQGNNKINTLEEEVNEYEETERQLRENNMKLEQAVREALDIAEMVKRITEQRDMLSKSILQKQMTCQSLQQENEELNAKLYQAQKEAMNLLILSGEKVSM